MAQANKRITLNTENKVVLNTEHEEALKDLARLMVEADRQWITQMEYDLTPDKAHNVQFFIRHWGSWAQAVEQAKAYMHLQQEFAPKPSVLRTTLFSVFSVMCLLACAMVPFP